MFQAVENVNDSECQGDDKLLGSITAQVCSSSVATDFSNNSTYIFYIFSLYRLVAEKSVIYSSFLLNIPEFVYLSLQSLKDHFYRNKQHHMGISATRSSVFPSLQWNFTGARLALAFSVVSQSMAQPMQDTVLN